MKEEDEEEALFGLRAPAAKALRYEWPPQSGGAIKRAAPCRMAFRAQFLKRKFIHEKLINHLAQPLALFRAFREQLLFYVSQGIGDTAGEERIVSVTSLPMP